MEHDANEPEPSLSYAGPRLQAWIKSISGRLVVLGAGGKMGPTLAVMARNAARAAKHELEVVAVSRFSDAKARRWLELKGVRTIAGDLLDRKFVAALPDAENVVYMAGMKFGTQSEPWKTWATNVVTPVLVSERYAKSRVAALSTGNVYPPSEVSRGGSIEPDPITPVGEYANSAVARERIFEYFSREHGLRVIALRLFYAVEVRYGVLVDIAQKVWLGQPIDLTNGVFNCIWQGDANEMILRSLDLASSPMRVRNLCREEIYSVCAVATKLGQMLGRNPIFMGEEAPTALLGNARRLCRELGDPHWDLDAMLEKIAEHFTKGGPLLGKPTHFETRDGKY